MLKAILRKLLAVVSVSAALAGLPGCMPLASSLPAHVQYTPVQGEAIVLVGTADYHEDYSISWIETDTNSFVLQGIHKGDDVFALRVPVGERFLVRFIHTVDTGSWPSREKRYALSGYLGEMIEKPGVYYYGTLRLPMSGLPSLMTDPQTIKIAGKKYETLLNAFKLMKSE